MKFEKLDFLLLTLHHGGQVGPLVAAAVPKQPKLQEACIKADWILVAPTVPKQPKLQVAVEGPSRAPALLRWQAAAGTLRFPSPVSLL